MASTTFAMSSVQSLSGARVVAIPRRQGRQASRQLVVRAEEQNNQKLDFKPNSRSGIGYLDEDSAGQTNIFAVEPRSYLKGSSRDSTSGSSANLVVGAGAAAVGGLVLAAGLLGGSSNPSGQSSPADQGLQSLSEYSLQFSSETSGSAPSLN